MGKMIVTVTEQETGEPVWDPIVCERIMIGAVENEHRGRVAMCEMNLTHLIAIIHEDEHMFRAAKLAVEYDRWSKHPKRFWEKLKSAVSRRHTDETQKTP